MSTLVGADQTNRFHLITLKSAIKLEKLGMTRRSRSAKAIAIEELGLPKHSTHDEVIAAIVKKLEEG